MVQDLITYILIGAALVYVFYQAFKILGRQSQESSTGCGGCSVAKPRMRRPKIRLTRNWWVPAKMIWLSAKNKMVYLFYPGVCRLFSR